MAAQPTTNITFQNFYSATLTADITAISTDIFLDVVPNGTEGFLVIDPDSTTGREIIYYNSKTATKVTCPSAVDGRGQDDTTAGPHLTGTTVIMAPVAAYYETLLALFTTSPQGWTTVSGAISAVTANGNRSYTLTTASDQSAVISPGMRLRTTRTVAAPTQCTNLNGTTQSWTKASPAGMTFTGDFSCIAWVKLTSYPAAAAAIIGRDSVAGSGSGWELDVLPTGQLQVYWRNATGATVVSTFQSLPLNKWVHIAMWAAVASTAAGFAIDGVSAPASSTLTGANTVVQATANLTIGNRNSISGFFPGEIAQAAIFNTQLSVATVKPLMSQGLTGAETSLISAYSFNNSFNDLNTTNANNLTANGSVVATSTDSPFGGNGLGTISSTLDYGIVQKVTSSTITVQVAEGCTIPTSGGVTSSAYSTYKNPFGFPGQREKWCVDMLSRTSMAVGGPIANTWYDPATGLVLSLPVGSWRTFWKSSVEAVQAAGGSTGVCQYSLSTSATAESNPELTYCIYEASNVSNIDLIYPAYAESSFTVSSTTLLYLIMRTQAASDANRTIRFNGDLGLTMVRAENAYL